METLRIEIEKYEGPLDLLLTLISKHKIDILDIPISNIADQYMEHIEAMRSLNMDIAVEFIYMAAELMLIKSKMLLPKNDEEDPRKPLVDALLEYQRAKSTAEFLKIRSEKYFDRFAKQPDIIELPYERPHEKEQLIEAFERIYSRLAAKSEQKNELFENLSNKREYSIEEKTIWLLRRLYRIKKVDFDELFKQINSINELCAAFLALLQLIGNERIDISRKPGTNTIYVALKFPERK
ncbi:MAG: hypothetical protein A2Y17_04060 [Clostridiales bacterium GWF2_38_85]|nr:MAG: hypothetical protein A2Y17_04060 [Clostridiales bacterium GWF2_38_85]HBL83472.1 serine protease [Clostridiales bacterium]